MNLNQELSKALEIATQAGLIQLEKLASITIEIKDDHSPVTQVDKKCEEFIMSAITKNFPSDGFLGEETGTHKGTSDRTWIVDPLDGTRPYIRGIPTHSVLIALEQDSQPVLGVIHLPALNLTCWANKNNGAFLNNNKIHVSNESNLSKAMGSALGFLEKSETLEGKQLFELMRTWDYNYGFMDAFSYVGIASGKLDICVNLLDKAWDCTAAACIINEAGGQYSDIYGAQSTHNGSILFSNRNLHSEALSFFQK